MNSAKASGFIVLMLSVGLILLGGRLFVPGHALTPEAHSPILIDGNGDFTSANGVIGGSGTAMDPYVIQGWEITPTSSEVAVEVNNTDAYLIIKSIITSNNYHFTQMLLLSNVSHVTIESSVLKSGHGGGIAVSRSSNVRISENEICNAYAPGVLVEFSTDVTVSDDLFSTECSDGSGVEVVLVQSSSNVTLSRNMIHPPGSGTTHFAGIGLYDSANIIVTKNIVNFDSENKGIAFSNSTNVVFSGNDVGGFGTAVWSYLKGGSKVVALTENTFSGRPEWLEPFLALSDVSALALYHNNFTNSGFLSLPAGAWDNGYPSGGNFWANYTGVDNCSGPNQNICPDPDGIGDTPYIIDSESVDRYPLMKPFITPAPSSDNPGATTNPEPSQPTTPSQPPESIPGLTPPFFYGVAIALTVLVTTTLLALRIRRSHESGGKPVEQ